MTARTEAYAARQSPELVAWLRDELRADAGQRRSRLHASPSTARSRSSLAMVVRDPAAGVHRPTSCF